MKKDITDQNPQGVGLGWPREGESPSDRASTTGLTEIELASETVFKGRLMHVKCDRMSQPNNGESTREYIIHPGAGGSGPGGGGGGRRRGRRRRGPRRREGI